MRAGDSFTMLNRGKTSFDAEAFRLLYLPIIGTYPFALYQLMLSFSTGRISHFLEYLNLGLNPFIDALDKLSGLSLVRVYDDHTSLCFELKSPLNFENFLADDFYRQLLISRIGENRVAALAKRMEPKGKEISKKFHEVYKVSFDSQAQQSHSKTNERFDMGTFKSIMERQGYHLNNENQDTLTLYSLAEKFELNWYELFKQAEKTANADKSLDMNNLMRSLSGASQPQPALSGFPKAVADLIVISKSHEPDDFIRQIKAQAGGFVSSEEHKLLTNLSLQNLPAEVQNILTHYVLVQQKNASLNPNFVNALANDWMRNDVFTAETAVKRILEREELAAAKAKTGVEKRPMKIKKEAPKWSNSDYENKTSQEELTKLEKIRLDSLKKLKGEQN